MYQIHLSNINNILHCLTDLDCILPCGLVFPKFAAAAARFRAALKAAEEAREGQSLPEYSVKDSVRAYRHY